MPGMDRRGEAPGVFQRTFNGCGQRFRDSSFIAQRRIAAAHLNEDFIVAEVAAIIAALPNIKATEPGGLVAELVR